MSYFSGRRRRRTCLGRATEARATGVSASGGVEPASGAWIVQRGGGGTDGGGVATWIWEAGGGSDLGRRDGRVVWCCEVVGRAAAAKRGEVWTSFGCLEKGAERPEGGCGGFACRHRFPHFTTRLTLWATIRAAGTMGRSKWGGAPNRVVGTAGAPATPPSRGAWCAGFKASGYDSRVGVGGGDRARVRSPLSAWASQRRTKGSPHPTRRAQMVWHLPGGSPDCGCKTPSHATPTRHERRRVTVQFAAAR